MPAVTRIDTALNPTSDLASLTAALKTAMGNAGFAAPFDEYVSGGNNIVYREVFDAAKTKGTAYLKVQITSSSSVIVQLFDNWSTATHTGTNGSSTTSLNISYASINNFVALNHSELKGVLLNQSLFVGYIRPANKPSWWEENNFLFAFTFSTSPLANSYYGIPTTGNPYNQAASATFAHMVDSRLNNANPLTNKRDLLPGVVFLSPADLSQGIAGRSSDDLVVCAASSTNRLDNLQVNPGTEEYLLLIPGSSGLAICRV